MLVTPLGIVICVKPLISQKAYLGISVRFGKLLIFSHTSFAISSLLFKTENFQSPNVNICGAFGSST